MPCHFEMIGAQRPFDDTDVVRQSGVGASPARSWQHMVARAIVAYLLDAMGAHCVLASMPHPQRVILLNDLERLVDTYEDDREGVSERIFHRFYCDYALQQEMLQTRTEHEIFVMMDDCYQLIDGNHQPLKRL